MPTDIDEIEVTPIQTDQIEVPPLDFLNAAANTIKLLKEEKVPGPDDPTWKTYWSAKDKDAWSLVWDSFVKDGTSLYQYYKAGASVPYTFDSTSTINGSVKDWGVSNMSAAQQANATSALAALGSATGLTFTQVTGKLDSGMVIAMSDLGSSTYGQHFFDTAKDGKTQFTIVLNRNWYGPDPKNAKTAVDPLTPGDEKLFGYVTLLHEFAHAAGLDDAEGSGSDHLATVNPALNSTAYTLMAYSGGKTNTNYMDLDRRALGIIYRKTELVKPKPNPLLAEVALDPSLVDTDPEDDTFTPASSHIGQDGVATTNPGGVSLVEETHEEDHPGGGSATSGGDSGSEEYVAAKLAAPSSPAMMDFQFQRPLSGIMAQV